MSSGFHELVRRRLLQVRPGKVALWLTWLVVLTATGWLVRGEVLRPETPAGVSAYTDLVFREVDGRRLRLDIFVPIASRPARGARPAVLALHGGGWRGGSKTDLTRPDTGWALGELVRRGVVVVAVDYRLSSPASPSWPGNLEDVREAIRWVRRHAREYAIDPERLALLGASAGGHLALLAGESAGDPETSVSAVIDFYGPTDLRALAAESAPAAGAIRLLLGGPEALVGAGRYAAASPVRHLRPDGPPVLIFHGDDDRLVPLDQSRRLARALETAGVPHRLAIIEGARHGFGLKAGTRDLVPEILEFLDACWARVPISSNQQSRADANSP